MDESLTQPRAPAEAKPNTQAETLAPPAAADPDATAAGVPSAPADGSVPPELADHPHYRVLGLIGQGGMGAVYKAEHRLMERTVALKLIKPALFDNPGAVQRFRQEVKAAARLQHPNIVTAHDAGQAGPLHFLVMEYVEGRSLAEYLQEKGTLPAAEACEYARQAAVGLRHAHEKGMVHRDVKPHNLMRTPDGLVKILDFGLSRFGQAVEPKAEESGTLGGSAAGSLTQAGAIVGMADYMAPEQATDSHRADIRADIYSLGCTLYHLLTGSVPYPGGSVLDKLTRHAVGKPPDPRTLRRDLSPGLAAVVRKMMARDPADRFQTPGEVATALTPFVASPRKRRRRRTAVLVGLLAVLLAAGVSTLIYAVIGGKPSVPNVPVPIAEKYPGPLVAVARPRRPTPCAAKTCRRRRWRWPGAATRRPRRPSWSPSSAAPGSATTATPPSRSTARTARRWPFPAATTSSFSTRPRGNYGARWSATPSTSTASPSARTARRWPPSAGTAK